MRRTVCLGAHKGSGDQPDDDLPNFRNIAQRLIFVSVVGYKYRCAADFYRAACRHSAAVHADNSLWRGVLPGV